MAYSLIFLIKGGLSWEGLKSDTLRSKQDKVLDQKTKISPEQLCLGLDPVFKELLIYSRSLEFADKPDDEHLTGLLKEALKRNGFNNDNIYPWAVLKEQKEKKVEEEQEGKAEEEKAFVHSAALKDQNSNQAAATSQEKSHVKDVKGNRKSTATSNETLRPQKHRMIARVPIENMQSLLLLLLHLLHLLDLNQASSVNVMKQLIQSQPPPAR